MGRYENFASPTCVPVRVIQAPVPVLLQLRLRLQASRAQRQQLRRGERSGGSGDELASLQPSLAALPGPVPIPVPMPAASGSSSRPGAEGEAAGGSHGGVLGL